jgi:hypothetical protein
LSPTQLWTQLNHRARGGWGESPQIDGFVKAIDRKRTLAVQPDFVLPSFGLLAGYDAGAAERWRVGPGTRAGCRARS